MSLLLTALFTWAVLASVKDENQRLKKTNQALMTALQSLTSEKCLVVNPNNANKPLCYVNGVNVDTCSNTGCRGCCGSQCSWVSTYCNEADSETAIGLGGVDFIKIGAGDATGVTYRTGGFICKFVNRNRKEHNIRCAVESTAGSVSNIETIRAGRAGDLNFGMAHASSSYQAYNGVGKFSEQGTFSNLRAMFSLHTAMFTIVARADSGINTVKDLKGRRVNIGSPGSDDRLTMSRIMDRMGWTTDSFSLASELKLSERSQALCDNKIDAWVALIGHPNGPTQEATTTCDVKLVPVIGAEIEKLVQTSGGMDYFTALDAGMYRKNKEIPSFGEQVVLVTRKDMPNEVAYKVAQAVFENFGTFKRLHPAFSGLEREKMVKAGLYIPLHPGAEKYFKEVGLLE